VAIADQFVIAGVSAGAGIVTNYVVGDVATTLWGEEVGFYAGLGAGAIATLVTGITMQNAYRAGLQEQGMLPGENVENLPKEGTLSNEDARKWYLEKEAGIADMIDDSLPLEEQSRQAVALRNMYRTQTRALMADREAAALLDVNNPNQTYEQIYNKYAGLGFEGDALFQEIINASQRSNPIVNELLGIVP
jgi:filamentous hemagglutinin